MRINLTTVLIIGMTLVLLSGRGLAASEIEALEELKNCARTEDSAARISCYEELGKRVLGEESVKAAEVAVVEADVAEPEVVETKESEAGVVESGVGEPAPTAPLAAEGSAVTESKVVETVSPQPEAQRLPDDLGIEKKEERKPAEKKSYRGHVRSCGQMSDDKWYFVFDSGQVWKQSSEGVYRFKECDFDVTITKDFFSYKMKVDGGKTLRVKRER